MSESFSINGELFEQKKKLISKDKELMVVDLDDTIFSRNEQLKDSKLLRNNRWKAWNRVVLEDIGLDEFIDRYYRSKQYPDDIVKKMSKQIDLILTAGNSKIQTQKLKALGLAKYNYKIVENSQEKPLAVIKYVFGTLEFTPSKIKVYEDRPKYFIENRDNIEQLLNTKLEIIQVLMHDNKTLPKLKKITKKGK